MADRDENGKFKKGTSGNPGGMPKEIAEVRRKLCALLPEATHALAELLEHRDGKVRIMAVREVYDRTLGKPKVTLVGEDGQPAVVAVDIASALQRLVRDKNG